MQSNLDRVWKMGFDLRPGEHAIVPVMLYDAELSQRFANRLLEEGIYVIGFFYPVVPKGLLVFVFSSLLHSSGILKKHLSLYKSGTKNSVLSEFKTRLLGL